MNQYQPYFNGYQSPFSPQPFGQVQQPMLQQYARPQQPPVSGRMVNAEGEITVDDVPGNGSAAFFPLNDGSAVIAKAWNNNGGIVTVRYVPEAQEAQPAMNPLDTIQSKLDGIAQAVNDLACNINAEEKPKRTTRTRKEEDNA